MLNKMINLTKDALNNLNAAENNGDLTAEELAMFSDEFARRGAELMQYTGWTVNEMFAKVGA